MMIKLMTLLNTRLTIVLTGRPVLAPPTGLVTSLSQPARGTHTGPVHRGAVGEVLAGADSVAALAEGVDRTGTVTVLSRVAGLADTLTCPGVAPRVEENYNKLTTLVCKVVIICKGRKG